MKRLGEFMTEKRAMIWLSCCGAALAIVNRNFEALLWSFSAFIGWLCYYHAIDQINIMLNHLNRINKELNARKEPFNDN